MVGAEADAVPQGRREGAQALAADTSVAALRAVSRLLDSVEGLSRRVLRDRSRSRITHSSPDRWEGLTGLAASIISAILIVFPGHLFSPVDVFTVRSSEASLAGASSLAAASFSATHLFTPITRIIPTIRIPIILLPRPRRLEEITTMTTTTTAMTMTWPTK